MVTHQTNRTFICSTVFVDLVEYSRKSVSEQLALKDRFTTLLADALEGIDINERIILDTGDGAAMSFLGDPEHALAVGMSLRRSFRDLEASDPAVSAPIRIGINLGPVKLVKDINGHPNIVGDGINVAQRIMSFADSGQILVSRSFHDVVARLSEDYAALFKFEGSRTDKHVRDHEVYAVGDSEAALQMAARRADQGAAAAGAAEKSSAAARVVAASAGARAAAIAFLHDRRKVAMAGGALGVLIVALGIVLAARKPAQPGIAESKSASAAEQVAQQAAPAAEPARAAPAVAERPASAQPATEKAPAKAAAQAAPAPKPAAQAAPAPKAALAPTGTVHLAVRPWGEVFVNGHSRGVSPPLKTLKLPPGTYSIEVRNTTFTPGKQQIQVKANGAVTVRYVFK